LRSKGLWWLILLGWLLTLPGQAQGLTQLQRQLNEAARLEQLQKNRLEQLNRELRQLDRATQQNLTSLSGLQKELGRLETERAQLSSQIRQLEKDIAATETRLANLDLQLAALKKRLQALISSLHHEQAGRYLPVLQAESWIDLAVRSQWIGYLGQQQTNLVQQIQQTRQQMIASRNQLVQLVSSLNQKQSQRAQRIQALTQQTQQLNQVVSQLRNQSQGQQVLLQQNLRSQATTRSELNRLTQAIAAEQRRLAEEQRRRAEAARRAAAAQAAAQRRKSAAASPPPVTPPTLSPFRGKLSFPIVGGQVRLAYGRDGNDYQEIRGPADGSAVRAAADGKCIYAIFIANYGWMMLLQHDTVLFTYYVNIQNPQIELGETVKQGQLLGYTGGGALIPSDVLWFRVGRNSESGLSFVDPAGYF
jgi:septal ring factor EnvC (AmiA/AmiB activator)